MVRPLSFDPYLNTLLVEQQDESDAEMALSSDES